MKRSDYSWMWLIILGVAIYFAFPGYFDQSTSSLIQTPTPEYEEYGLPTTPLIIQDWVVRATPAPIQSPTELEGDWTLMDSATGFELYGSTMGYLVVVRLDQGARVVLTGKNSPTSMQEHWSELSRYGNPACVTNGTFFEASGVSSLPYKRGGNVIADGAVIQSWSGAARILATSGANATVMPFSQWGQVSDGLVGISPRTAGDSVTRVITVGVKDAGATVLIITLHRASASQAEDYLFSLGVPNGQTVQFDGGGSVALVCRTGTMMNTSRNPPTGIGVTIP